MKNIIFLPCLFHLFKIKCPIHVLLYFWLFNKDLFNSKLMFNKSCCWLWFEPRSSGLETNTAINFPFLLLRFLIWRILPKDFHFLERSRFRVVSRLADEDVFVLETLRLHPEVVFYRDDATPGRSFKFTKFLNQTSIKYVFQ